MNNLDTLAQRINNEYKLLEEELSKPNILLIGATGVGKSSLINVCFGTDIAQVGVGQPVTRHTQAYHTPEIPIVLFDTQGYEIGSQRQEMFMDEVVEYAIDDDKRSVEEQIHLIWYCIAASGHRVTDWDRNIIKKLSATGKPVAVVFTKSDLVSEEDINALKEEVADIADIVMFQITKDKELQYLELGLLCQWSVNKLPDAMRLAFAKAQKISLDIKKKEAKKVIMQHTSGAGVIGFAPIPFSDAPILLSNQVGMFSRVLYIYDMGALASMLKVMIKSLGIGNIISNSGIWLAGQLLKLVPGFGTVVGGVITGSVAASITGAMGYATSELCYQMYETTLNGDMKNVTEYLQNAETTFGDLFNKHYQKLESRK